MRITGLQKVLVPICALSILILMVSCGGSGLAGQIFNTNFLADTGLQVSGAEQQVAPGLTTYLLLKVTNQTTYPAKIAVRIKRAQTDETFNILTLAPNQTMGKLIEGCDSADNPVLSLFVPRMDDNATSQGTIPIGQVFVTVGDLPVVIPATELPGTLNVRDHFNCGDTVEFVVHSSFTDANRFRVSALVFAGTQ
ncbi:MAG: hypothetical protein WC975_15980 [Phycisphaerae bacterium]